MSDINNQNSAEVESIHVQIEKGDCEQKEFHFHKPFRIGRDEECEIQLNDGIVSRCHIEVFWLNDQWWVSDLDSANGTFVDGEKIDRVPLKENLTMQIHDHINSVCEDNLGVAVMVSANHMCACVRGVRHNATMKTSKLSGAFKNAAPRQEFYNFVGDLK